MKTEVLILYLDREVPYSTYCGTLAQIQKGTPVVITNLTHFLQFRYADSLGVWYKGEFHSITLGKCDGIAREIAATDDIEQMLLAGEFKWFRRNKNEKI